MTTNCDHVIVNPFMEINDPCINDQMIQNQGSFHIFIQTVMCDYNGLVE